MQAQKNHPNLRQLRSSNDDELFDRLGFQQHLCDFLRAPEEGDEFLEAAEFGDGEFGFNNGFADFEGAGWVLKERGID